MLVENQPLTPSRRALRPGARIVFMSVWPVLKSLPAMGVWVCLDSSPSAGMSMLRLGGPVGVRDAHLQRRVCIDHARRDRLVVVLQALLERLQRLVDRTGLQEDLGARAPDHHDPVDSLRLLERLDVGHDLLRVVPAAAAGLHPGTCQRLDVALVEDCFHGPDHFELVADPVEIILVEGAGVHRGFVGVVLEDVPAAEPQIVEPGQPDELLDRRYAPFRSLAQADGSHLRQGADRLCQALAHREHAGYEGSRDRADSDGQDPEAAFRRRQLHLG